MSLRQRLMPAKRSPLPQNTAPKRAAIAAAWLECIRRIKDNVTKRTVVGALFALSAVLGVAASQADDLNLHSSSTAPITGRYEIVQPTLLARDTYRVDKYLGRVHRMVASSTDGQPVWKEMRVHDRPAVVEEIRDSVFAFVAEQVGVSATKLSDETTLFGDLGVDGDDGVEFLRQFSEHFQVDISSLQVGNYFGPEGIPLWAPFSWVVLAFRSGSPEERARLKPIAMGLLVRVAYEGCWPRSANS